MSESVSDVDAEEMAKVLKEADDIDDELFGLSKKSSRDPKKQLQMRSSSLDKDHTKKKKIGFGEFDDSDPLGDISLSDDDDFYGIGTDKEKPVAAPLKTAIVKDDLMAKKPAQVPVVGGLDKSSKSKLIADLFGLDKETENVSEQPSVDRKKSDWLGIKESPKKAIKEEDEIKIETSVLKKQMSSDFDAFDVTKDASDSAEKRKFDKTKVNPKKYILKSSTAESKPFENSEMSIFDLLSEKREEKSTSKSVNEKKFEISEELFSKGKTAKSTEVGALSSSEIKHSPVLDGSSNQLGKSPETITSLNQYMPSSGSARRPGFGRRRDSFPVTSSAPVPAVAPPSPSIRLEDDRDWLSTSKTQEQKELKDTQSSSLPPWLGGDDKSLPLKSGSSAPPVVDIKTSEKTVTLELDKQETSKSVYQDDKLKDDGPKADGDTAGIKELLNATSALGQQSASALEQTENRLLSVVQIKQHKDMISELANRQNNLLKVQEQQMNQLVHQQLQRQQLVEMNMRKQQDRINVLIQSLISESLNGAPANYDATGLMDVPLTNKNYVNSEEDSDNENSTRYNNQTSSKNNDKKKKKDSFISQLEIAVHKLEIEKTTLAQQLECLESRHEDEIKTIEKFHGYEISSWEEREDRLKQSLTEMQKDYEDRISRSQEREHKLVEQHNFRVESLQQERMADLKQVGEFHRLAIEQVANIGKFLFDDTRLIESKRAIEASRPIDISELSARETALILKEKDISVIKDGLEKQRILLAAEKEELEEKNDQEKRILEETQRQLKRQQTALKQKEEEFIREQEREKEFIRSQRKQLEELKESALREQTIAMEERIQIAANQARLDVLTKLHGQDSTSMGSVDIVQARGEVEGALAAVKEVKNRAEEEKQKIRQQQAELEAERWRMQELETELTAKKQHIEQLMKISEAQHKEGVAALEEANQLKKIAEERSREAEQQLYELAVREKKMMKEKMEITKERAILEKKRAQLDLFLPQLTPSESFSLGIPAKNFIDPKKLIMKLKAEKELET